MISRIVDQLSQRVGSPATDRPSRNRYSNIPHESHELDALGPSEDTSHEPGLTFTPDEAISHIGFGRFHVKLVLVLGLVWMVEGMEIFVLSVLAPYLRCEWNLSYFEETLLPVLTSLGMMLSAPIWGWICDVYGRKKGLYISSIWFMYFALLSTFSPNYKWLLILRFLVGAGIGSLPQVSTILAEYTPTKARGKVLTFITVFWSVGFIFAAVLSLWLMIDYGFRVLLGALCIPGILFLWSFRWMPESFRFYAATGQTKKTLEMLRIIAKANHTDLPPGTLVVSPPQVQKDYKLVTLTRGGYCRLTLTLWVIWFISIMMYYASVYVTTEIFQRYEDNICVEKPPDKDMSCQSHCKTLTRKDYFDSIWASVGEFPGIVIGLFLVDSLGRKRSMYCLAFFAIVFQSLMFICLNRLGVTILLMIIRCVFVGFSAIVYVYTVEAYPTTVRATGMGSAYFFGRIGMLVAPIIAEALFHLSVTGAKSFLVISLAVGFFSGLSLPFDTTDRQLV